METSHRNLILDRPSLQPVEDAGPGESFQTPVIQVPGGFLRAAPSWNVRLRAPDGVVVRMRVGRGRQSSSFLHVGEHGTVPTLHAIVQGAPFGEIETDEFVARDLICDWVQLRFTMFCNSTVAADRLSKVALAFDAASSSSATQADCPPTERIPVPFRSQFDDTGELGPRVCGPTCLAMVLAFHRIQRSTATIARACHDARHDIYGNWPRAVQVAFDCGLNGTVRRFATWDQALPFLRARTPLIASVRFEHAELPDAAIDRTDGHLVVITGLGPGNTVLVNDPAFLRESDGVRTYPRDAFAKAWFGGSGIAWVLGD